MTNKELFQIKKDLSTRMTELARSLYSSKTPENKMKVSGVAQCIKLVEDYEGPDKNNG